VSDRVLSVLIADDEAPARRGLRDLLDQHTDLRLVAEARNGREAIEGIQRCRPDIVILDIQMPDGDGFDVLQAIGVDRMPVTIFATAYDAHALRAFEAQALDYLLKPYDRERFASALQRARAQLQGPRGQRGDVDARLLLLLDEAEQRRGYARRLPVKVGDRIRIVDVHDVEYFEADGNYVRLHMARGPMLVRETLTTLERRLDPARFTRVHRSIVVQTARVAEVEAISSGEYVLFLHGGKRITSGRSYRAAVRSAFGIA
jgi:two-component system LytT family response regulator